MKQSVTKPFDYYQASLNLQVFKMFIERFPNIVVNILLSYGSVNPDFLEYLDTYRHRIGKIILDCGTWTLNYAKNPDFKRITLDNYIRYLKRFGHLFDFYFNFDDNFTSSGVEKNQYNQKLMEDAGLSPVPVVHDIYGDEIDQYIYAEYKRVALGSSQVNSQRHMAQITRRFDGTGTELHLLGQSGIRLLGYFPISSSDSTLFANPGKMGFIKYWNPQRTGDEKTDTIYLEERISEKIKHKHMYSTYEYKKDLDAFLQNTFGLDYYDLVGKGSAVNKMLVNMYYAVQLEAEINRMHQGFGFTGRA